MPRDVVGACPLDCPDASRWVVTVDDNGHAVKLRGNPDHAHTRNWTLREGEPVPRLRRRSLTAAAPDAPDGPKARPPSPALRCARAGLAVTLMGGWTKSFMAGRLVNATVDEGESDMDSGALCHDNRLTIRPDDPST